MKLSVDCCEDLVDIADGQSVVNSAPTFRPIGAAMVLGAVRGAINQVVSELATINIDQLNAEVPI